MHTSTSAAVLSIGTELTRGELVNGNAAWLADELIGLGFEVTEHVTVDDDIGRIEQAVRRLAAGHEVLVCTGGLGPTTDDLTTEAFARALDAPLVRDPVSLERIRAFFAARGRVMSPSNEKQADFPQGAEVLANDAGTAPGFAVQLGRCRLFVMPGVPSEMRHIFRDRVLPRIAHLARRNLYQVHLRTFGMPESELGDLLSGIEERFPGVTIGYRASFPEIEVKVLARAADEVGARQLAERAAEAVRLCAGDIVFGGRDDSFASCIGDALRARGQKVAVAEACTSGLIGSLLTSVPDASDYLLLDAVVYADAAKTALLGVSEATLKEFGAVSAETATAMAHGALRVSGADLAVAVTGIPGPGGGTPEKPVGTVFIAGATQAGKQHVQRLRLAGSSRERIRITSAYTALRLLLRLARGIEP